MNLEIGENSSFFQLFTKHTFKGTFFSFFIDISWIRGFEYKRVSRFHLRLRFSGKAILRFHFHPTWICLKTLIV